MYDKLISLENLFNCWDEYKKGKAKKFDVMAFERHLEDNIFSLHENLKSRTYKHGAYETFHIYDPKHRLISKAGVRDRVVHHIVYKELYDIFDLSFIYHSYASRINKGTHLVVRNVSSCLHKVSRNHTCPSFALKCDIKKFFRSVSHKKLLQLIKNRIEDKSFLELIERIIRSFPEPVGMKAVGGGLAYRQCNFANFC